jgi:hypothetical protein
MASFLRVTFRRPFFIALKIFIVYIFPGIVFILDEIPKRIFTIKKSIGFFKENHGFCIVSPQSLLEIFQHKRTLINAIN